ncbi:GPI inositol deacylase [Mortierella sp. NVP41]|nr:GPI inositol deacylase [Mortierella sp. NVP41]
MSTSTSHPPEVNDPSYPSLKSTAKNETNASPPPPHQRTGPGTYISRNTPYQYPAAAYGCSGWLASLLVFSAVILGCVIHSSFNHQLDPKGCIMTYMQPSYYRFLGFDETMTRFSGKYRLLLYRDDEYDDQLSLRGSSFVTQIGSSEWAIAKSAKIHPTGVPALFIPGNAGSAKQVRSMAKEASRYYYETLPREQQGIRRPSGSKPIDFFTVDFNEEFSAFHGQLLEDQAHYVNEAIAYILSLYADNNNDDSTMPRPTSVLIIGHSMGGIVARSIFTTDNYIQGSVHAILTVATPHMLPPIELDSMISSTYARIESFWKHGFQTPHSPLANVSMVSIMGGNLDITVNSDSGNIHHLVPQSHGFSVFTSSIPHAWVGTDHLSILWCNQVAMAIGRALVDLVDAGREEQVKPLDEQTLSLSEFEHTFVETETTWAFPPTNYNAQSTTPHLFIAKLPASSDLQGTITVLTDHGLGDHSRLDVFLCKGPVSSSSSAQQPHTLSCRSDKLPFVPIPASTDSSTMPLFTGEYYTAREFRFVQKRVCDLEAGEYSFLVILDRGRQYAEPGFLLAEFRNEAPRREVIETTTMGLLVDGLKRSKFPERLSLVSTISLPNMDSSLLAYNLKVSRPGCQGQRFAPMMRQSSWAMHEDKYSVNIANKPSGIDINFHGDLPYFDKIQLGGNKGVELHFWMDPTCPEPLSLTLKIDKYGSLGKVVIRYRMVVLAFTFVVVLLTLKAQVKEWVRTGEFMPFGKTLSRLVRSTFWQFSVVLAGVSVAQHLLPQTVADIDIDIGVGELSLSHSGSELESESTSALLVWRGRSGRYWFGDAILGDNDAFFWFLAPVFFQVAIGIVAFVWILLNAIVKVVALLTKGEIGGVSRNGRRVLKLIAFSGLVHFVVPYQFAFAATLLWLIWVNVRALNFARHQGHLDSGHSATSFSTTMAWNQFHFSMSMLVMFFFLLPFSVPALMVWIRNFAIGWWKSFEGDHSLGNVLPFLIFVEGLSHASGSVDTVSWRR